MSGSKGLVFLLLCAALTHAVVIGPKIYEQKDLGDTSLDTFIYSMSVDCTAAAITVIVMDGNARPVEGAYTFLKYIDFSSPVLGSGPTDKDGMKEFRLPGNPTLMRGLFILVIEKRGYRSKEIHFDITGCLTNQSWVPPPPPPPPPPRNNSNATNTTAPPINPPPMQNATNMTNATNNTNASGGSGEEEENEICPFPGAMLAFASMFLFLKANARYRFGG